MSVPKKIVEKAAKAEFEFAEPEKWRNLRAGEKDEWRDGARAALEAVLPDLKAEWEKQERSEP